MQDRFGLAALKSQLRETAGKLTGGALLICLLSGLLLALPYDPSKAFGSIFDLVLFHPAASFVRNLHYWSAQAFLIFLLFHVGDHLFQSTEQNIR
ncbi:MAG: DUF4405 domain-containing protein, partial [Marinilabiliales bacterium]|nr:DUF4405 domain-containing protein [Marinilabiliales bacterium]